MALSADDLNAVRALWEEWTADLGFELTIEVVLDDGGVAELRRNFDEGTVAARLTSIPYCRVEIRTDRSCVMDGMILECGVVVFRERVSCDLRMLRASVSSLARNLAERAEASDG